MFAVHWRKIIVVLCVMSPLLMQAQFTVREYENRFSVKPYHFGIALSYNTSDYRIRFSDEFVNHDSILVVQSTNGPGFNMGIISNLRIGDYFDLRFIPSLSFTAKSLDYTYRDETQSSQTIESTLIEFPFGVKFKSAAYKDMKVYVLGGVKYSYDLSSNANARNADGLVKIKPSDISIDGGIGFEFYFPYFIFCPEVKLSRGIINVQSLDPNLQESSVMQKLFTRSLLFSFNIEG